MSNSHLPLAVLIISALAALVVQNSACHRCPTTPQTAQMASSGRIATDGMSGATAQVKKQLNAESFSISGLVRKPTTVKPADLAKHPAVSVRFNDVHRDGTFHGIQVYEGVPLQALLEQAEIAKPKSLFDRLIDLAIVITNRAGEKVVLSWGEVFYRHSADVLVAYTAVPKMPHKPCSSCHAPSKYQARFDQLTRQIALPKLIVLNDHWSDRAIEGIASIEVKDLGKDVGIFLRKEDHPKKLISPDIRLSGPGIETVVLDDFSGFERLRADLVQAGDGTGFHGIRHYEGVSLSEVLQKAGLKPDPSAAFLCSAPDGYRALLSSGEVFFSWPGSGVIVADAMNGQTIDDGGRFRIIPVKDLPADRWLKSVSRIELVSIK